MLIFMPPQFNAFKPGAPDEPSNKLSDSGGHFELVRPGIAIYIINAEQDCGH
jgi:hypothetical protein